MHRYANVPGVEKVVVNDCPFERTALWKEPPSAVAVCEIDPVLVHVTVLFTPITTLMLAGWNALSTIDTFTVLGEDLVGRMAGAASKLVNRSVVAAIKSSALNFNHISCMALAI